MHSSRMRTGRSLTVCRESASGGVCVCSGEVCVCLGGVSAPGGMSAPGGVSAPGGLGGCSSGVSAPGGCLLWGMSARGVVCSRGWSALGGVCGIPACTEADTPPREQNDRQVQKYYLGHNFVAAGNNANVEFVWSYEAT